MMKFGFALLVLCCIFSSVKPNMDLNTEIINQLKTLDKHSKDKNVTFTCPENLLVPSSHMQTHAPTCVRVFIKEMRQLLGNVTAQGRARSTQLGLHRNLDVLEKLQSARPHQEDERACRMKRRTGSAFKPYVTFMKYLNNSNKR